MLWLHKSDADVGMQIKRLDGNVLAAVRHQSSTSGRARYRLFQVASIKDRWHWNPRQHVVACSVASKIAVSCSLYLNSPPPRYEPEQGE